MVFRREKVQQSNKISQVWLEINNHNQQPFIQNLIPKLEELCQNLVQDSVTELINCTQFTEESYLFNSYLNFLPKDNGSLPAFWMTYSYFHIGRHLFTA